MFIKTLIFIIFIQSHVLHAQTFNLGRFSIGRSRIEIDTNDFNIEHNNQLVETHWVKDSVQWIRNENNLLVPRALLSIQVLSNSSKTFLNYQNKTIFFNKLNDSYETQIYIDLFNPDTLLVYEENSIVDKISIMAHAADSARSKQLIDYSCSPYQLKINGIDNEYLSVGCKMHRLGHIGDESPRLEITLSTTNLRALNQTQPPYTLYMESSKESEIQMKDADGELKTLKLSATLPKKLHRLNTAFGLGPYIYESQNKLSTQSNSLAPSFMIYGKLDFTETASLKAFDALLYSKSFFNNSGAYFSYDLALAFDERVLINALLGFQGLHYRFTKNDPTVFRLIYPQGFEVIYRHAFMENYNLTYGMFLSTSAESYTNAWLRYGKKTFLELNYIKWGFEKDQIKMWGLSIGMPFLSAF